MLDTRTAPYGIFVLRVALGAMWISHALLKYIVFTMPGFAGFLGSQGLPEALGLAGRPCRDHRRHPRSCSASMPATSRCC